MTFNIDMPAGQQFGNANTGPAAPQHALSSDGTRIAFIAYSGGESRLWVRGLSDLESTMLSGTDGAVLPFWSPDGRSIAFFADGELRESARRVGRSPRMCELLCAGRVRGDWGPSDDIIVAIGASPLLRVPSSGGAPVPVTSLEPGETHRWPQFLPDGRRFLYVSLVGVDSNLYVGSLDSPGRTLVRANTYRSRYAQGYLLTVTGDAALTAQPFDADQARTTGEPRPIIENVGVNVTNTNTGFSVSDSGALTFRRGAGVGIDYQLVWVDRSGTRLETVGAPRTYGAFRLSPDGRALVARVLNSSGRGDWWLIDLERAGLATQLTFTGETTPSNRLAWSPDGARIAFGLGNPTAIFTMPAQSGEKPEVLYQTPETNDPTDWSRDGRIFFTHVTPQTGGDVWTLNVETREAQPFLATEFSENSARVSPDGLWVAYASNEEGIANVYVRPSSPADTRKWKISSSGGQDPRWRPDGRELIFRTARTIMTASVRADGTEFQPETPRELFRAPGGFNGGAYQFSADGQRILLIADLAASAEEDDAPVTVVLNWQGLLR